MSRARLIAVAAVLLIAAGLGAAALLVGEDPDRSTARVTREDLRLTVEAAGRLEAAVAYEIGPPSVRDVWSHNLEWMIPEGTVVQAGQVIARFDATQLDDQLRDHRAALEKVLQEKEKEQRNLEVSLKQLRLDLVKAQGDLKTVDLDLSLPEGLVSFIEFEQTRLEKQLAEQRVAFLREKIDFEQALVESKLRLLDVKREYEQGKIAYLEAVKETFNVKAPVAGLVVYVPKQNGDRWEVGESVWMLAKILKVADVTTLQAEADVLEVDASRLRPGQPAEVSVDAVPGLVLTTEVAEIGRIVHERSAQDRSKVFDAILPLGAVDTDVLRPGMGIQVRIRTALLEDRLTVPLEAVRTGNAGPWLQVVGRGGRVERRPVTLGERDSRRVVVASGVEEGETVLLAGADA